MRFKMKRVLSIQSHVVYGSVGNKSAVFPLQRMGLDACAINTVQFSNHTQYKEGWQGLVMPKGHIENIVDGLDKIDILASIDGVLSGYLGSAQQGREVLSTVRKVKKLNPKSIYVCDPVMGHPEKACFVSPEVSEFFCQEAVHHADYLTPNLQELETLCGVKFDHLQEVIEGARSLVDKGIKAVLVKHLGDVGQDKESFEMLLVTSKTAFYIKRPLYNFRERLAGVGDLISSLFMGHSLLGYDFETTLERTNAAVHGVVKTAFDLNQIELPIIASQHHFEHPHVVEKSVKISNDHSSHVMPKKREQNFLASDPS